MCMIPNLGHSDSLPRNWGSDAEIPLRNRGPRKWFYPFRHGQGINGDTPKILPYDSGARWELWAGRHYAKMCLFL